METAERRRTRLTTAWTRAYRLRHPERVKESRLRVYWKRKRRAMEMLGGAVCVQCKCDEIRYLEINHIGGGGSLDFRENGNSTVDRLLSGKRSADGLNVLCRVCNAVDFLNRKTISQAGRFVIRWEAVIQ